MEAALFCWVGLAVACAFVLSHTADRYGRREFRWFLCGLVLGFFSLAFLAYLRRAPEAAHKSSVADDVFSALDAATLPGSLDDPLNTTRSLQR